MSDFPEFAQETWERIRAAILDDAYQPKPVLRVEVPKQTGGFRPLGIPSVIYRLIQQSIYQALLPMFDPEFSDQSYGSAGLVNSPVRTRMPGGVGAGGEIPTGYPIMRVSKARLWSQLPGHANPSRLRPPIV